MRELVNNLVGNYKQSEIELELIGYFINSKGIDILNIKNNILKKCTTSNKDIQQKIKEYKQKWEFYDLINLFEHLVSNNERKENGVVFTPKYIVEYIISNIITEIKINDKIIDPACGCGTFLCVLAQGIKYKKNVSIIHLIENNIYGLDISKDYVRRTKLLLATIALVNGEDKTNIKFNIVQTDSLKNSWDKIFSIDKFKYVIGNPPYVNTHNMTKENITYLKKNFKTTRIGTFNIFYAFIEQSMKYLDKNGKLGFIIPNNFIAINSAKSLRSYLINMKYISKLINFNLNLVFDPIKTYNAIVFLDKSNKNKFEYSKLPYKKDIQNTLLKTKFETIKYKDLNEEIWHLINASNIDNIKKIENIGEKLDKHIRTGIATLKDVVYKFTPIKENDLFYYMVFNNKEYKIEKDITKNIVKISSNNEEDILNCRDRIIFPYEYNKKLSKYTTISKKNIKNKYPNAYQYLKNQLHILNERSSQAKATVWYEYGRSQGLNNYGTKLIYPTFSAKPKFMIDTRYDDLFLNGYAIFVDGVWDAKILQKILNSKVMTFYIKNTSYSLEGGFLCYQKKYLKNFSIPNLTEEQTEYIKSESNKDKLDKYIINIYKLNI